MKRSCDACGASYEAKRSTSKYCSSSCRARKAQGLVLPHPTAVEPSADSALEAATRAELTAAGRLESALGVAALNLARRIDSQQDPGTALAALTRQWQATLESATRGAARAASPLDKMRDELAARRGA